MSPELRKTNEEKQAFVSEGKAPKPTTETRVSSKNSKKSQTEVKKPERMTFGPSGKPELIQ